MHEASKAALRRLHDPNFASVYFVGDALDIGAGPDGLSQQRYLWPRLTSVRDWDLPDGDAQELPGVERDSFDVVHSSHCLEHMRDAAIAFTRWYDVVRPGGYLVTLVPDEDMYEQGVWPSTFNPDHKWTFTPWKRQSWSLVSLNVVDLMRSVRTEPELVQLQRLERTWNPLGAQQGMRWDRTGGQIGESAIEFVIRKRR